MLVPSTASVMEELLKKFKPCFTKPQFRNFSTYILGLVSMAPMMRVVDPKRDVRYDAGEHVVEVRKPFFRH
jgi:hypothetical protein